MELHKRARSDAAHRAEEEVREYLQQFYCRVIPEEEFEAFLGACAELENHRRDGGAPALRTRPAPVPPFDGCLLAGLPIG